MTISLVVAAADNNAIGKDNKLLWHLPNDMKFFKNTTWGMPILMGRKTLESLGKPLNGRISLVLTRQKKLKAGGVITVNSLGDAILFCEANDYREIFVIGGGEVYELVIDKADKIYITRVHTTIEADTFFPAIDPKKWKMSGNTDYPADEKHIYPYSIQVWERW